jgi:hypothetical protein
MLQENSSLPVYTWMLKLTRGFQQFDTLLRLDRRFSLPNLTPTVFCGVDSFVEPGVVFVRSSRPLLEFSSAHVREVCSAPLGKSSEEEATVIALLAKALGGGPRWQSVATFVRSHRFFWARPFVLGICGLSGSGKSTLGRAITQQVNIPAEMISSDNFLKWGAWG